MEKQNVISDNPKIYQQLNKLLMARIQGAGKIPWQKPDAR